FVMRCAAGKTQADMAKALGCTQGSISKLENSCTDVIKVGDLLAYAKALDLNSSISFHKGMTSVESVKYHAFEIQKHLDHLANLAKRDDDILNGVKKFYGEALFNILHIFEKSAKNLHGDKRTKEPVLEVCAPTVQPCS
ncbi:MAG: helix-turn-helix transcriptional regulator, partial [Thermodesulfobacteriota bacterium]|nr:helix-turn-helix transcriptional regulator [Thermodesulfobacteriota bacterium]